MSKPSNFLISRDDMKEGLLCLECQHVAVCNYAMVCNKVSEAIDEILQNTPMFTATIFCPFYKKEVPTPRQI